jgi:hypothetical protein
MEQDRGDQERAYRAEQLDDREHALDVVGMQREAGDEQCRNDGRAEADAN